ncbi:4-hydroxyphenylpyruvate dioxygenase [Actinokineospora sp. NPDC004072]
MHVQDIDHVEFHVGDADGVAAALCAEYGFRRIGARPHAVLLGQGRIRILLTGGPEAAAYVAKHGDGLAAIALATDDPDAALAAAVHRGAVELGGGRIRGFGDVAHVFVRPGAAPAGIEPVDDGPGSDPLDLLAAIDHVAACVRAGELDTTVAYYEEVLGFKEIFEERIVVGGQAMNSKVVQSVSGEVTVTLLEPDHTAEPGQIDTFLAAHSGPGVQHLAFRTADIAGAVRTLSARGVRFLDTPAAYYDDLDQRIGSVGVPVEQLRELSILVDRDSEGELFQIFTQTTHPRRTLFFEIIERMGALTFGSANIKALYQAVEREQGRTAAKAG